VTNEQEHQFRLKGADRLLKKLDIRNELRSKLYYTYPRVFEGLFELLSLSETMDFVFALQMHFAGRTIQDYPGNKDDIKLNWWLEPNINYSLLIQEVFDDYWVSFLCFSHGFTKQSLGVLRNTYELILALYYLKFCDRDDEELVKWIEGKSGVKKVERMIESVKKIEFLRAENIFPYLMGLWRILCMATHSHKKMMTSMTVPAGLWFRDKRMFEEFAVMQTRAIFLFVVETELKMMKCFIENDERTPWERKVIDALIEMQQNLKQYSTVIEDIKKGYILHRKRIALDSGRTVLFSLKINNEPELAGKVKSLSRDELRDLDNKVIKLLQADDTITQANHLFL